MKSILEPKTELLVALGSAVAAKCQTCFAGLHARAREAELTDAEIRAVVAIGRKVADKSNEFMIGFVEKTAGIRVAVEDVACGPGAHDG